MEDTLLKRLDQLQENLEDKLAQSHGLLHSDLRGDLKLVRHELQGVNNRLDTLNGKVASHEKRLNEGDIEHAKQKVEQRFTNMFTDKLWHLLWITPATIIGWFLTK